MKNSNSQFEDQVFDSLVQEAVGGPRAPDLTNRIVAAWRNEQQIASAASSSDTIVDTVIEASVALPAGSSESFEQVEGLDKHASSEQETANARAKGAIWGAVLASMATCLLLALGFQLFGPEGPAVADKDDAGDLRMGSGPGLARGEAEVPGEIDVQPMPELAIVKDDRTPAPTQSTELNLDNLPFSPKDVDLAQSSSVDQSPRVSIDLPSVQALERTDLIAALDDRMQATWTSVDVQPTPDLEPQQLRRKIETVLTGSAPTRDLSEEELVAFDASEFASDVVSRGKFPQHWADQVVREWLRKGSLPLSNENVRNFSRDLARQIAEGRSWGDMTQDLLSEELPEKSDAFVSSGEVMFASLLGDGNQRFLNRVGVNFLNQNLACIRCHAGSKAGAPMLSQQEDYWSLLAVWNGMDAWGSAFKNQRWLVDKQARLFKDGNAPTMFFDLPNGRLKAATAALPGQQDWSKMGETPRAAFANWVTTSPAFDEAVVNQTWKLIFGRRLVPTVDGIDLLAISERRETLEFLAAQFRAHDRDLSELVTWIVASDAFAKELPEDAQEQWLLASDEALASQQLAEYVFASGGSAIRKENKGLGRSLAVVAKWGKRSSHLDVNTIDFLPQPDFSQGVPESVADRKRDFPPLGFVVHGERATTAQRDYVQRLMKSRMNWEQRVSHVVWLNEYEEADQRTQQLAQALLESKGGDVESALLALLWAINDSL